MDEHQRDVGVEQQEPDEDARDEQDPTAEDEPWPETALGDAESPGT